MKNVLITGAAGFIGFHLAKKLLKSNYNIIGIDNVNDFYDQKLKRSRLNLLDKSSNFIFFECDFLKLDQIEKIFKSYKLHHVIHLGAQVGVKYSVLNPYSYVQNNILGFLNILESCKSFDVKNLIYASSSTVYGDNKKMYFSESNKADEPVSVYGASKKSNELFAHVYANSYGMKCIGLRFFSVYGPWGRPDMAYYIFAKSIISGNRRIEIFNNGDISRCYTYIDDVIDAISKLIIPNDDSNAKPFEIFNIGGNQSVSMVELVRIIENICNKKAEIVFKPKILGDVGNTYSNIKKIKSMTGFVPKMNLEKGMENFIRWYKKYHKIDSI